MNAYRAALARLSVEDRARAIAFVQFLNGIEGRCRGAEYPSRTEKLAALIMEVRDEERARCSRMLRVVVAGFEQEGGKTGRKDQ